MRVAKDKSTMSDNEFQKPLDISTIGTDDDPCFGKLFEPATEECSGCGESELCAVVCMHYNGTQRKAIAKKQKFKDQKPSAETESFMAFDDYQKIVEKYVKKNTPVTFTKILSAMNKKYNSEELLPEGRLKTLTKNAIITSTKLKKKTKNGKAYIRSI